jgi:Protein of unknown function (DUF4236)
MGFRFYKRVNLIPGLRMNLSRRGPSLSVGHRGAWFTIGPRGKRVTVGGLGTGLYYTEKILPSKIDAWCGRQADHRPAPKSAPVAFPGRPTQV